MLDDKWDIAAYPDWQEQLCRHRPPTQITWRRRDPFFPGPAALADRADLPDAELHLFDTGRFALEDHLPEVAPLIADFLTRTRTP